MYRRSLSHRFTSTSYTCPSFPSRLHRPHRSRLPVNILCTQQSSDVITVEEVRDIAASRGIDLYVRSLGPFYRVLCRDISQNNQILAVTTGFVVPFLALMHCDTLQIFTRNRRGEHGERVRGGVLGLGLLVGGATFAYGREQGCQKAEILAINDDDMWHERLVKYYRRFGFVPVRVVTGGKLSDIPHLLVWGGSGTRMDADIEDMLRRWTPAIRNARRNSGLVQQKEILHE